MILLWSSSPHLRFSRKNWRKQGFSKLGKLKLRIKFIIKQKRAFYLLMTTGKADLSLHHILFCDKVQAAAFSTTKSILGKNEYILSLGHFTFKFLTRIRVCRKAQGKNTACWLRCQTLLQQKFYQQPGFCLNYNINQVCNLKI